MWFIWLALGLTLMTVGGLFVRSRLVRALGALGLGPRGQRVVRWLVAWLLFGYPTLMFGRVAITLALGGGRMGGFDGPVGSWLLVYPFFLTVLVVVQALPYQLAIEAGHQLRRRLRRAPSIMTRTRAWVVVAPIAVFAIYTPARILWERGDLRWRHHQLAVGGGATTAAPPPFRIVFVADVQEDGHTDAAVVQPIMTRLAATGPDLVLSGGDWINTGPDYIAAAARSAGLLRGRLGALSVRGDHEHFAYVDRARSVAEVTAALADAGVEMVHNQVRRFEHHGRTIAVALLTFSYPSRTSTAAIEELLAALDGADVKVLVTHQLTAAIAAQARDRVDLILAAHTHGGQVNPVVGMWHVPLARLETPYVDGRYQVGRTTIIVTAGIGMSLVPFRYASPGSVEIIDLIW